MAPFSSEPGLSLDEFERWNDRYDCRSKHPFIEHDGLNSEAVLYTIGILFFSVIVEGLSRAWWEAEWWRRNLDLSSRPHLKDYDTSQRQATSTAPQSQDHSRIKSRSPPAKLGLRCTDQLRDPSRSLRIHRFVLTTFFLVPDCVLFAYRVKALEYPEYCYHCGLTIAPPRWWAIAVFNIVPLACASMAWLRTVVDCILVRWGRSVRAQWWPPGAPVLVPMGLGGAVLGLGIQRVMKIKAGWSGRGRGVGVREENLEFGTLGERGEEEVRLMGEQSDEAGVYSLTRSSLEGKT